MMEDLKVDAGVNRFVMIEWHDAFGGCGDWKRIKDINTEPLLIRSVGWVLSEDANGVVIVPHVSAPHESCEHQGCGEMYIPKRAIVRERPLYTEPVEKVDVEPNDDWAAAEEHTLVKSAHYVRLVDVDYVHVQLEGGLNGDLPMELIFDQNFHPETVKVSPDCQSIQVQSLKGPWLDVCDISLHRLLTALVEPADEATMVPSRVAGMEELKILKASYVRIGHVDHVRVFLTGGVDGAIPLSQIVRQAIIPASVNVSRKGGAIQFRMLDGEWFSVSVDVLHRILHGRNDPPE